MTTKFLLVSKTTFAKIGKLCDDNIDQLDSPKVISHMNRLLKNAPESDINPLPEHNTHGMLWQGNIIVEDLK